MCDARAAGGARRERRARDPPGRGAPGACSERIDLIREIHERVMQRLFGLVLALGSGEELSAAERRDVPRRAPARRSPSCARRSAARSIAPSTATSACGRSSSAVRRPIRDGAHRRLGRRGSRCRRAIEPLAQSVLLEAIRNAEKHADSEVGSGRRRRRRGVRARGRQRRRAALRGRPAPASAFAWRTLEALQHDALVEFGPLPGPTAGTSRLRGAHGRRGRGRVPLRVLVVDDHDVVQWGFRLLLERQPWVERCFGRRTGDEALELVRPATAPTSRSSISSSAASRAPSSAASSSPRRPDTTRAADLGCGPDLAGGGHGRRRLGLRLQGLGRAATSSRRCAWSRSGWRSSSPSRRRRRIASAREREVVGVIASGATNREIAEHLYLSPHTVKEHTARVYRKLDVRNRAEAVKRAQRLGLIG